MNKLDALAEIDYCNWGLRNIQKATDVRTNIMDVLVDRATGFNQMKTKKSIEVAKVLFERIIAAKKVLGLPTEVEAENLKQVVALL